jgi:hypothetical protein
MQIPMLGTEKIQVVHGLNCVAVLAATDFYSDLTMLCFLTLWLAFFA